MTYRTPENLIRSIMSGQSLEESATSDHMNPGLKTSDADRLSAAVNVLKSNGVDSAEAKDNSVSISAAHANMASDILDRALMHGVITVKPMLTSAEAIAVPTAHNPAMAEAKEDETEINQGEVDEDGQVKLQPRSLNNRTQNQIKKIDESIDDSDIITLINTATRPVTSGEIAAVRGIEASAEFDAHVANLAGAGHFQANEGFFTKNSALVEEVEQVDEISTKLADSYLKKAVDSDSNLKRERVRGAVMLAKKANKMDGSDRESPPMTRAKVALTREETELNELSYGKLVAYTKKGMEQLTKSDPMDARIARRKAGLDMARKQKVAKVSKVSKVAFGEGIDPVNTVLRVLKEAGSLRLIGTHKSDCGKHEAKVYKDTDWNEHRVKFFIHGKHHEPGDYHTDDKQDAHITAQAELGRLTKLNGALKEAEELGEDLEWINEEIEQVDELSKALLGRYMSKAEKSMNAHGAAGDNYNKMGADKAAEPHWDKAADRDKHIGRAGAKRSGKKMYIDKEGNDHRAKVSATEEVDQLQEISKGLATSYAAKASADRTSARDSGDRKRFEKRTVGLFAAKKKIKEEVADEGTLPFQPIEEISKESLTNYAIKATKSKNEHIAKFTAKMARGNAAKGEPEVRAAHHDAAAKSHRKLTNRHEGIKKAVKRLGEEIEQLDEFKKVGTYNNKSGAKLTMHTNSSDPKHHMLVRAGKVVDSHHGTIDEFHKKLTKAGFSGALHEEQIDELSHKTLSKYTTSAAYSLVDTKSSDKTKEKRIGGMKLASKKRDQKIIDVRGPKVFAGAADGRTVKEDITEGKKDDVEKSKKHLFKHPEADAIGQTIHTATRHFNYVQDACDHVYSNHCKDLSYEDYDKMKPHLEDTFKKHGLK